MGGSARAPGPVGSLGPRCRDSVLRHHDLETPRAAGLWGARASAREQSSGCRTAAPTAAPGRGQRRPDTSVLGSPRTCPPARRTPGHALSQSQALGGKRHCHLWRFLSRLNATSNDSSPIPSLLIWLPSPLICAVASSGDLWIALGGLDK